MRIENRFVYWKEQCEYCINKNNCESIPAMTDYIHRLERIKPIGPLWGNLEFKCSYFILDKEEYDMQNPVGWHCCG
jgi:hypothetical protein